MWSEGSCGIILPQLNGWFLQCCAPLPTCLSSPSEILKIIISLNNSLCHSGLLWFYVVLTIHTKYAKKERISRQSNHKWACDLRNLWNISFFDFRWPLRATFFYKRVLPLCMLQSVHYFIKTITVLLSKMSVNGK